MCVRARTRFLGGEEEGGGRTEEESGSAQAVQTRTGFPLLFGVGNREGEHE